MTELTQEKAAIEQKGALGRAALTETTTFVGARRLQEIRKEKGPKKAYEAFQSVKPVDEQAGASHVERMGIKRNNTTGAKERTPGTAEYRRFEEAGIQVGTIETFLKEGFDKIGDASVRQEIIDNFERALMLWPESASVGPADRRAYIEKRLKDPKFIGRVKDVYEGTLKVTDLFDGKIVEAESAFETAKAEEEAARKKHEANRRAESSVSVRLSLFENDATGTPRAKLAELERLKTNTPTIEKNIKDMKDDVDDISSQIEMERTNLRLVLQGRAVTTAAGSSTIGDIQTEIARLTGEMRAAKRLLAEEEGKLERITQLEQEKQTLEAEKARIDLDEVELKKVWDAATYELTKNRAIFEDAKNTRATQEDQFVAALKNVFLNASLNDAEGTIKEWEDLRTDRLAELEGKIGDMAAKKILECDKRWTELKPNSTNPKDIKIKKDVIERDYLNMLQNGPEALMRTILAAEVDAAGVRVFSDNDIENKIADPEFINQVQSELVSQLLFRRMNVKKPSETEVTVIATSKWGEGMFLAAAAKDKKVSDALDLISNKYGATRGEKLRNLAKDPKAYGFLAGLIALALGAPFLIAGAGIAASAYSSAVGAVS